MKTERGLDLARCYLQSFGYSLVVVKECVEIVSHEHGIMPLLMIYDKCASKLEGSAIADKVIGKAAAMILAETSIKEVYAEIMSQTAIPVLEKKGIRYNYGKVVPEILNKSGTDLCPLEKLCRDMETPIDGIMAITAFICREKYCVGEGETTHKSNCKCN